MEKCVSRVIFVFTGKHGSMIRFNENKYARVIVIRNIKNHFSPITTFAKSIFVLKTVGSTFIDILNFNIACCGISQKYWRKY